MNCKQFQNCSAAMCPLDTNVVNMEWFSNEEICRKHTPPAWVRNQKKISKKAKDEMTYFTLEMLKRNCIIKGGITGISPDWPESPQIKIWMKKHPEKRKLSDEEKQQKREMFIKNVRGKCA